MSKTCGCLGCTNDATHVINHDQHGKRTVCGKHVDGYKVVRRVNE